MGREGVGGRRVDTGQKGRREEMGKSRLGGRGDQSGASGVFRVVGVERWSPALTGSAGRAGCWRGHRL